MKQAIRLTKYISICILTCLSGLYGANSFAQTERELYENYRLNAPLLANRDVSSFKLSPNGQRVVFIADSDVDGKFELFSVSIRGGAVIKLNQAVPNSSDVTKFTISTDGRWVVYQVVAVDGTGDIYSIAIDGSGTRMLEAVDSATNASGKFALSSKNVLVWEGLGSTTRLKLRAIRGVNSIIRTLVSSDAHIIDFDRIGFSDSGGVLVYSADKTIDEKFELFSNELIPTSSNQFTVGAARKLNSPIDDNGDVNANYIISSDGSRVVYSANRFGGAGDNLLYSADTTGQNSTITLLNISTSPQKLGQFKVTPNGQRVIFEARLDPNVNEEVYNYFSIPIAGGTRSLLTPWSAGNVVRDFSFDISTDSQYLVLANNRFGPDSNSNGDLYRIDIDVGVTSTIKLNELDSAGSAYPPQASITPDGKTVIFSTQNSGSQKIYALPLDRFVPNNGALLHNNPFTRSRVLMASPNSEQVIYRQKSLGAAISDPFTSIFVNDVKGGNPQLINTIPINTTMSERAPFDITPNGEFAVYLGQESIGVNELFAVRIREPENDLCLPILASNGRIAVICL